MLRGRMLINSCNAIGGKTREKEREREREKNGIDGRINGTKSRNATKEDYP